MLPVRAAVVSLDPAGAAGQGRPRGKRTAGVLTAIGVKGRVAGAERGRQVLVKQSR